LLVYVSQITLLCLTIFTKVRKFYTIKKVYFMNHSKTLEDWMQENLSVNHYKEFVQTVHSELGLSRQTVYSMRHGKSPIRPIYRHALNAKFKSWGYDATEFFNTLN
jgi:hypothetical protein